MKRLLFIIFLISILLLPVWAGAAVDTHYVTQSGAGAKDGAAIGSAFSAADFNTSTNWDTDVADDGKIGPGDTVYFSGSITTDLTLQKSGSSGNVITLDFDDGVNPACTLSDSSRLMEADSIDYITIKDLTTTGACYSAIYLTDCSNWTIQDSSFTATRADSQYGLYLLTTSGGGGLSYLTVQDCAFSSWYNSIRITQSGASTSTSDRHSNITVDGCTFTNDKNIGIANYFGTNSDYKRDWANSFRLPGNMTYTDNTFTSMGSSAFQAMWPWGTNLIARNHCTDIGTGGNHTNAFQVAYSRGLTIEDNYISGVVASEPPTGGDGQAIILDHGMRGVSGINNNFCKGVIVRRNFCRGADTQTNSCGVNLYDAQDCEVYNNVLVENNVGITSVGRSYNTGNKIYNNIIANNNTHGIKLWKFSTGVPCASYTWTNNIIANNGGYCYYFEGSPANQDITYTLYYGQTYSNTDTADATDINADPLFVDASEDNYSLRAGSPAINAGIAISDPQVSYALDPDTDWVTVWRTLAQADHGTGWEIGAYVYEDAGAPTNHAPNGLITTPASNITIDVDATQALAGSYTDSDGDTCTYAWVIPTNTFKVYAGGIAYTTGDLVEDDGVAGDFYKCNHATACEDDSPPSANWLNAETQASPGTGTCDLAGVYTISLTVSDDAPLADPTPAIRSITVEDVTPGTTTFSRNTGDTQTGDATYIRAGYPTTNYGSSADFIVKEATTSYYRHGLLSFDLTSIDGDIVTGVKLGLRLIEAGSGNCNFEVWSETLAFVEDEATWNIYSTGNDWPDTTHGAGVWLAEIALSDASTENQYYEWEDNELTSYVAASVAASSGVVRFMMKGDAITEGAYFFNSDDATDGYRPYLEIITTAGSAGTVPVVISVSCNSADGSFSDTDLITNGAFASDTVWTKSEAAVTISGGTASFDGTQTGWAWIRQTPINDFILNETYEIIWTLTRTAGSCYAYIGAGGLGSGDAGPLRSTSDTFTENVQYLNVNYPHIYIQCTDDFVGDVDDVSLTKTIGPFTVTFNEPVDVTGTPVLTLDTDADGANDATSNYVSGSGSATLTFASITVTADHHTTDLDALKITTTDAGIAATDDAEAVPETADVLDTFPTGATVGSLALNKDIIIDVTAPTIPGDIGILVDGDYEADHAGDSPYATAGATIDILLPIDGQVYQIGNPYQPVLSLYAGKTSTTVAYAYSLGVVEISGVWYLKMRLTLTAGMRTLDLQTLAVETALALNGCTIKDAAGNNLTVTLPETDVGDIIINVPGHFTIGAGMDIAKISDLVSQADTDLYIYYVPVTDNVEITADDVMISGIGRTQVNTGTMTFSGNNGHVRCVNFSGAVTGAGSNGNTYHPICGHGPDRMGMNPN